MTLHSLYGEIKAKGLNFQALNGFVFHFCFLKTPPQNDHGADHGAAFTIIADPGRMGTLVTARPHFALSEEIAQLAANLGAVSIIMSIRRRAGCLAVCRLSGTPAPVSIHDSAPS